MALAAQQYTQASEEDIRTAFGMLLSSVVIRALCPALKSEVGFGDMYTVEKHTAIPFWIQELLYGDLRGTIAIGCNTYTARNLAKELGGSEDSLGAIVQLFQEFCDEMKHQLSEDEFKCEISSKKMIAENFQYHPTGNRHIICPIETKYGSMRIFFELDYDSCQRVLSQYGVHEDIGMRRIRVSAAQLDSIYERMERIEALEQNLMHGPQIRAEIRSEVKRIKRTIHHIRKEPIELLFSPAKRLVVEISKSQGKQIKIATQGTWLHFDKNLLNYLYSPILHLIRNAVDHGIEEPMERERLGKAAYGYVKCLAAFSPHGLRLVISDDGRGLDFEKIRTQAVSKGLISEEEALERSNSDLGPLIFQNGFSTRERTDNISGRGLGLDLVKKEIEAIGGTLKLLSTSHHGTSFEILIPLNEHLTVEGIQPVKTPQKEEDDEKAKVLDEFAVLFARLARVVQGMEDLKGGPVLSAAYEAHRIIASIKGITGFAGWNWVSTYCGHMEDLLIAVSESRLKFTPSTMRLLSDGTIMLRKLVEHSHTGKTFPLFEMRQMEGRLLQTLWACGASDEKPRFSVGKLHLRSMRNFLSNEYEKASVHSKKVTDFKEALAQPFGAVVQFTGDRQGYAALVFPEKTFATLISPVVEGSSQAGSIKTQLWAVRAFAARMGKLLTESAKAESIQIQSSAPMTFAGSANAIQILGRPTYCYSCSLNGADFYILGDFRIPHQALALPPDADRFPWDPNKILTRAKDLTLEFLSHFKLEPTAQIEATQSDLMGFDQGLTAIFPIKTDPNVILFFSFEAELVQFIQSGLDDSVRDTDIYGVAKAVSEQIGTQLNRHFKGAPQGKIEPTIFLGKVYVPGSYRLFLTQKANIRSSHGGMELQIILTELYDHD